MENLCTETDTFCMEATIRGYHVYRDIWEAAVGEVLLCKREPDNRKDRYAVATTRAGVTVGHVPKKISSVLPVSATRWSNSLSSYSQQALLRRFASRRIGNPVHANV